MNVSIEISMYPLQKDFIPIIDHFLAQLHAHEGLKVNTNNMSTQVFGNAATIFPLVQEILLIPIKELSNVLLLSRS